MLSPRYRITLIKTASQQGTGIRLSRQHVLTCEHVIGRSKKIEVEGSTFQSVISSCRDSDLALLEVKHDLDIPEVEWAEEIDAKGDIQIFGFPLGNFDRIDTTIRATHSDDSGLAQLEILAAANHGMSGGLAVLKGDPLTSIGLVRMGGEFAHMSLLTGTAIIRKFLHEKCGLNLNIRPSASSQQLHEYLRILRQETGFVDLRALKIETGTAHNIPLEEIYTPLNSASKERPESKQSIGDPKDAQIPLESLLKHQHLLIQGEAGSGKSTFLRRVAFELSGGVGGFPALPLPSLFPILLKVAHLETHIRGCDEKHVTDAPNLPTDPAWLPHFLAAKHKLPPSFFLSRLSLPSTLILLDGLDESPTPATRLESMRLIEAMAITYPNCRFAITTRPRAGVHLNGFHSASIEPLTNEAREKFVADWTRFLFRDRAAEEADRERNAILSALAARPEIDRMASNPLMLTILAVLYWNKKKLPEERAQLYQAVLASLAEQRPRDPSRGPRVSEQDCLDYFSELAYCMQTSPTGRLERIELDDAADLIRASCPDRKRALAFLHREEVDSGIIVKDGNAIKFWHLTFQEFLAARHIEGMPENAQQYDALLRDSRLYQTEWREVVRLYAGILANSSKRKAQSFFDHILGQIAPSLDSRAQCVAMLDAIETDLAPLPLRISNPRYLPLAESMQDLFEPTCPTIDVVVKASAANVLDKLDPNPRLPLLSDASYWVPLPAGEFTMGAQSSNKRQPNYDPDAESDEPVRRVQLAAFSIARFPVTVHEYAAFIRYGGTAPSEWERQTRSPSHPVVNVSWHDAQAYCRWRKGVRLPTEEEWEYAARGKAGRKYPWASDAEPDQELANCQMNVGGTTAVGLFPKGNSPEGVSDLAGNVWEWTSSDYDENCKVARGGSFVLNADNLRAAFRDRNHPDVRYFYLGFRLIRE